MSYKSLSIRGIKRLGLLNDLNNQKKWNNFYNARIKFDNFCAKSTGEDLEQDAIKTKIEKISEVLAELDNQVDQIYSFKEKADDKAFRIIENNIRMFGGGLLDDMDTISGFINEMLENRKLRIKKEREAYDKLFGKLVEKLEFDIA